MEDLDALIELEDGHFIVDSASGRALLIVYPPGSKGKAVRLSDVLARLHLFGVHGFKELVLEAIVDDADGQPHDIGVFPEPDAVDAKIEIEISEDGMEATAVIQPPLHAGAWISETVLMNALSNARIIYGLKQEWKDQLLEPVQDARTIMRYPIACGHAIEPGTEDRVQYEVDPHPRTVPREGRERVDFRKLNVIPSCEAERLLATVIPGTPGKPGITVRGEIIPVFPLNEVRFIAGKNTRIEMDGLKVFSVKAGQVRIHETTSLMANHIRVDVEDVLRLPAVDFSTGHIDFPGTVVVMGTITDGFEVKAAGDVIIEKSIGNVHVHAGGDILLSEGIIGRGDASLNAGGQIISRFVQSATLYAGSSITIGDAVLHSKLVSGLDISIEEGKGELIGGEAICAGVLRANRIGSRLETPTRIVLGLDPETLNKLRALDQEILAKARTLERITGHLRLIDDARARKKPTDPETEKKLILVKEKHAVLLASLEKQRRKLQDHIEPNPGSSLTTLEAHPGTEVYFGVGILPFRVIGRPTHGLRLTLDGRKIHAGKIG
ncbi:MAG: FapA family protein [Spirochaetia bacterium]|nr:FapA family protein [Spirochaetia bacterium]